MKEDLAYRVPLLNELEEKCQAEVLVLFVARAFEHYAPMGVPYIDEFEKGIRTQGEKRLREFTETYCYNKNYHSEVVEGHPAEKIIEYAKEKNVDLIIMGTHGRRGLDRIIFGSVADYVVKYSPIPVLTVNPYSQVRE